MSLASSGSHSDKALASSSCSSIAFNDSSSPAAFRIAIVFSRAKKPIASNSALLGSRSPLRSAEAAVAKSEPFLGELGEHCPQRGPAMGTKRQSCW